jgi:hypothetical protein
MNNGSPEALTFLQDMAIRHQSTAIGLQAVYCVRNSDSPGMSTVLMSLVEGSMGSDVAIEAASALAWARVIDSERLSTLTQAALVSGATSLALSLAVRLTFDPEQQRTPMTEEVIRIANDDKYKNTPLGMMLRANLAHLEKDPLSILLGISETTQGRSIVAASNGLRDVSPAGFPELAMRLTLDPGITCLDRYKCARWLARGERFDECAEKCLAIISSHQDLRFSSECAQILRLYGSPSVITRLNGLLVGFDKHTRESLNRDLVSKEELTERQRD